MIFKNSYSLEELLLDESFFNFYCQKNEKDVLDWEDWCEENTERKELVLEAFSLLDKLSLKWDKISLNERYSKVRKILDKKVTDVAQRRIVISPYRPFENILKYAVAAVLVIGFTVMSYELLVMRNKKQEQLITHHSSLNTNTDEPLKRTLVRFFKLTDGTKVQLKVGSELKLATDFGKFKRLVYLTGEAKFEVAHDSKRPFIVKTDDVLTTALGTVFVARSKSTQKLGQISLLEGKIKVEYESSIGNTLILSQGTQIEFDSERKVFSEIEKLPNQIVNWQHLKVLSVEKMKLGEVFKKLSESYEVQFKGVNQELENYNITGTFDTNLPLSDIMEILAFSNDFKYKIQNKQVIISHEQ